MITEFNKVIIVNDVFDIKNLPLGTIAYCEKGDYGIVYRCPCGCDGVTYVSRSGSPRWDITLVDDKVTCSPSVRKTGDCLSHYFIRENKVVWCSDSPVLRKG